MFKTILVANRGEVACRIIRTARILGIRTIAVYSEADKNALHVDMASDAICIGPPPPPESYLNIDHILEAIDVSGAEAVHPGYGFLSENVNFTKALSDNGVVFIGPNLEAIRRMGDKLESKRIADEAAVPIVPGTDNTIENLSAARKIAEEVGYPVILKPSAGGGGKGMRVVTNSNEMKEALKFSLSEAKNSFADERIFIEKYIENPRHIEIQIIADNYGNIVHLGERECSLQRRHQKVVEEAPSPFLTSELRQEMGEKAIQLASAVDYTSAGTVEFIVSQDKRYYFLEMNTRLQVEHPVTELVTGLDIVELMIRIAAGEKLSFSQKDVQISGWAMESRIYAEDPSSGFLPATGRLVRYREPVTSAFGITKNVRVDGGVNEGDTINQYYDPMIAKLITNGTNRGEAIRHMRWALDEYYIRGLSNNLSFLSAIYANSRFNSGDISTNFIKEEFGDQFESDETSHEDIYLIFAIAGAVNCITSRQLGIIESETTEGRTLSYDTISHDDDWVILWNQNKYNIRVIYSDKNIEVLLDGKTYFIESDWVYGNPIFVGKVNDELISLQIEPSGASLKIQHSGLLTKLRVLRPNAAALLSLMPEKITSIRSNIVTSPMPGLLVSLEVKEGDEVFLGQEVAVIEAMKMENQIFAECDGVVVKLHSSLGDNLQAGDPILEIE